MAEKKSFASEVERFEEERTNTIKQQTHTEDLSSRLASGFKVLGKDNVSDIFINECVRYEKDFTTDQSVELTIRYAAKIFAIYDKSKIEEAVAAIYK